MIKFEVTVDLKKNTLTDRNCNELCGCIWWCLVWLLWWTLISGADSRMCRRRASWWIYSSVFNYYTLIVTLLVLRAVMEVNNVVL